MTDALRIHDAAVEAALAVFFEGVPAVQVMAKQRELLLELSAPACAVPGRSAELRDTLRDLDKVQGGLSQVWVDHHFISPLVRDIRRPWSPGSMAKTAGRLSRKSSGTAKEGCSASTLPGSASTMNPTQRKRPCSSLRRSDRRWCYWTIGPCFGSHRGHGAFR